MLRSLFIAAALCSVLHMSSAWAQTNIDGRGGRFDDDLISNLEGNWRITRQIRGSTVENKAEASWVLNHQFLQLRMKDTETPSRYEALVLVGYIYSDKVYVAFWTDSFGAKFAAVGRGTRSGNSVEFKFDYPDAPFFNTFTWFPDRREWTLRMENQSPAGTRQLFAVDKLVRQNP